MVTKNKMEAGLVVDEEQGSISGQNDGLATQDDEDGQVDRGEELQEAPDPRPIQFASRGGVVCGASGPGDRRHR